MNSDPYGRLCYSVLRCSLAVSQILPVAADQAPQVLAVHRSQGPPKVQEVHVIWRPAALLGELLGDVLERLLAPSGKLPEGLVAGDGGEPAVEAGRGAAASSPPPGADGGLLVGVVRNGRVDEDATSLAEAADAGLGPVPVVPGGGHHTGDHTGQHPNQ